MNLQELRRFARWSEKIAAAERQLADELAAALSSAEKATDPLGSHIYRARARYRSVSQADRSKSGKRTERELESTYKEAMKFGFEGSFKLWCYLMRIGKSAEQLAAEPPPLGFGCAPIGLNRTMPEPPPPLTDDRPGE